MKLNDYYFPDTNLLMLVPHVLHFPVTMDLPFFVVLGVGLTISFWLLHFRQ